MGQPLQLACGDHTFPLLEHEHAMQLIAMLGFRGFDLGLMGNRSQVQPEQIRVDVPGWAQRIDEALRAHGLELADVFLIPWTDLEVLAVNHPDPVQREASRALFADVLELAARMGAPGMTVLPGLPWPDRPAEESFERSAEELRWRVDQATARGVRCSIEPHIGSVAPTPEAAIELVAATPGLEVTLDYTHFEAQGIQAERGDALIAHARHLHARGARHGRGQCAVKDSTIDYERIVRQLLAAGYDGYVAVEYVWIEWEHMNECDNVSETVLLRDQLRAQLAEAA